MHTSKAKERDRLIGYKKRVIVQNVKHSGIDTKNLNTKVRPQDDFFHFGAGGWNKRNPMPADKSRWGTFDMLRENSKEQLRLTILPLLKKKYPRGSEEQLVGDLWRSTMDEKRREKIKLKPLQLHLDKIAAIQTHEDLLKYMAESQHTGIGTLWGIGVDRDAKQSHKNTLYLAQGGLSLPDRDYYLKDDVESKRVRKEFLRYIPKILSFAGKSPSEGKKIAELVLRIETALAKASMTRTERRDPHAQYNKRTLKSFTREAPHIDWKQYFALAKIKLPKEFIVAQPKFFAEISNLFNTLSLEQWKMYLSWGAIDDMAPLLTKKMVEANFHFYATLLLGTKKMQPLWKRSVGVIDGVLGDALGKLYVKKYFDHEAKRRIDELVDNLFAAYRERLASLEWMSSQTKKKAFIKLKTMKRKLGYPSKWHSYKGLHIETGDYVGNLLRAHEYEFHRTMKKLKKKPDPTEWYMTPPTVNAYFDPSANEIAFPAGIMQPPFFGEHFDDAVNYGGIGSVIGHEITHGFDDEGRKYDHKGNLKEWWTAEDKKRFEARAKVLAEQFDAYEAIDGMHVNGNLTLGENIADLGGLIIAFKAFQKSQMGKPQKNISGFTPEQRFFLGYATTEAGHIRPELLKKYLVIDPHSPSVFRVNGPLSNMQEFYDAFSVVQGDKLYRAKEERAHIW